MNEQFKKKLKPSELSWIILNNLNKFDEKSDRIFLILNKLNRLKTYSELTHIAFYEKACEYYADHKAFPDIKWLEAVLPKRAIKEFVDIDNFSTSIYDDYISSINQEILRYRTQELIVDCDILTNENCQEVIQSLSKYMSRHHIDKITDVGDALDRITDFNKEFVGIKTGIRQVDEIIKVMARKSINVLALPQGHGKSTTAACIAYNAAIGQGSCVDYVCMEETEEAMWSKIYAIESHYLGFDIGAGDIYIGETTEEQKKQLQLVRASLMEKLEKSGGRISMLDSKVLDVGTYEEMCAGLEDIAERRGRAADLIIIDNVNCFEKFSSPIKDPKAKVNNMIVSLDGFAQSYMDTRGTSILLLAQVNREGLTKLDQVGNANESDKKKRITIDQTCLAEYNSLERKAAVIIIGFADATMIALGRMTAFVVKSRFAQRPSEPLQIPIDYKVCLVGGDLEIENISVDQLVEMIDDDDIVEE